MSSKGSIKFSVLWREFTHFALELALLVQVLDLAVERAEKRVGVFTALGALDFHRLVFLILGAVSKLSRSDEKPDKNTRQKPDYVGSTKF